MSEITHDRWCGKFFDIPPGTVHDSGDCLLSRPERQARANHSGYDVSAVSAIDDPRTPLAANATESVARQIARSASNHDAWISVEVRDSATREIVAIYVRGIEHTIDCDCAGHGVCDYWNTVPTHARAE